MLNSEIGTYLDYVSENTNLGYDKELPTKSMENFLQNKYKHGCNESIQHKSSIDNELHRHTFLKHGSELHDNMDTEFISDELVKTVFKYNINPFNIPGLIKSCSNNTFYHINSKFSILDNIWSRYNNDGCNQSSNIREKTICLLGTTNVFSPGFLFYLTNSIKLIYQPGYNISKNTNSSWISEELSLSSKYNWKFNIRHYINTEFISITHDGIDCDIFFGPPNIDSISEITIDNSLYLDEGESYAGYSNTGPGLVNTKEVSSFSSSNVVNWDVNKAGFVQQLYFIIYTRESHMLDKRGEKFEEYQGLVNRILSIITYLLQQRDFIRNVVFTYSSFSKITSIITTKPFLSKVLNRRFSIKICQSRRCLKRALCLMPFSASLLIQYNDCISLEDLERDLFFNHVIQSSTIASTLVISGNCYSIGLMERNLTKPVDYNFTCCLNNFEFDIKGDEADFGILYFTTHGTGEQMVLNIAPCLFGVNNKNTMVCYRGLSDSKMSGLLEEMEQAKFNNIHSTVQHIENIAPAAYIQIDYLITSISETCDTDPMTLFSNSPVWFGASKSPKCLDADSLYVTNRECLFRIFNQTQIVDLFDFSFNSQKIFVKGIKGQLYDRSSLGVFNEFKMVVFTCDKPMKVTTLDSFVESFMPSCQERSLKKYSQIYEFVRAFNSFLQFCMRQSIKKYTTD